MRIVSVFKYGNERAICLPRDMDLNGINELEITCDGAGAHECAAYETHGRQL